MPSNRQRSDYLPLLTRSTLSPGSLLPAHGLRSRAGHSWSPQARSRSPGTTSPPWQGLLTPHLVLRAAPCASHRPGPGPASSSRGTRDRSLRERPSMICLPFWVGTGSFESPPYKASSVPCPRCVAGCSHSRPGPPSPGARQRSQRGQGSSLPPPHGDKPLSNPALRCPSPTPSPTPILIRRENSPTCDRDKSRLIVT